MNPEIRHRGVREERLFWIGDELQAGIVLLDDVLLAAVILVHDELLCRNHKGDPFRPAALIIDGRLADPLLLYAILVGSPLLEDRIVLYDAVRLAAGEFLHVVARREDVDDIKVLILCFVNGFEDFARRESYLRRFHAADEWRVIPIDIQEETEVVEVERYAVLGFYLVLFYPRINIRVL
jgi:hypothetical protein